MRVRFAAVDVCYPPTGGARAAAVLGDDTESATIAAEHVAWLDRVAAYQPGLFFTRELPALAAVLALAGPIGLLIVDGYVDLDPAGRPGLGAHAHEEFGVPVIGVAKSAFRTATHAVPVRRGAATNPVYVTAVGLPVAQAAEVVRAMAGPHRLPDLARRADALCRAR